MNLEDIKSFYDSTAKAYAKEFSHELDHKPFDRCILERFATENKNKGLVADLGCGPGQATKFLFDHGVDVIGIDLSENMIAQASELHFQIPFEQGNILDLEYPDNYFSGIIAFYAIVHFDADQLIQFFKECKRLLKADGQLLFSFHTGTDIINVDELLGVKAKADFHFQDTDAIRKLLFVSGYTIIDTMIRYPYPEKEYQSKRAYILASKMGK